MGLIFVFALLLVSGVAFGEEEFSLPEEVKAFDVPNDRGEQVGLSWKRAMWEFNPVKEVLQFWGEAPQDLMYLRKVIKVGKRAVEENARIQYVVYIAKSEGGPFSEAGRYGSAENLMSEMPSIFGPGHSNERYHAVLVDPSSVEEFTPAWSAKVEELTEKIQEVEEKIARVKEVEGVVKAWLRRDEELLGVEESKRLIGELSKELQGLKWEREEAEKRLGEETKAIRRTTYFLKLGIAHDVRIGFLTLPIRIEWDAVHSAQARGNLFHFWKTNNSLLVIVLCAIVIACISHARKNPNLFLRRISGLDALEEAVGRATEMGRPVFYMTGRLGLHEGEKSVSTLAATIVLSEVARKVAEYECDLVVPHTDPIVASLCQEIIKEAYMSAGHPDAFNPDNNFFITNDQFSYTAAVNGLMLRDKPGAVVYMGYYYAEALLLAETGASTGAIQVAGTDSEHQLPFFITACDHTLIGEELYAASAYISRDPALVGTLRGQDIGKAMLLASALIGTILMTLGIDFVKRFLFFSPQ